MSLSMDPSVRYVTQSGVYGRFVLGPLTDRTIEKYRKQGYYGGSTIRQEVKKKQRRKIVGVEKLMKIYA